MTTERAHKILSWLRDWGILILAMLSIVLSIQLYKHEVYIKAEIKPKVDTAAVKIDHNTIRIDSLIQVLHQMKMELPKK